MDAAGSTLLKRNNQRGLFLLAGKSRKGRKRVAAVPIAITAMRIKSCVSGKVFFLLSPLQKK